MDAAKVRRIWPKVLLLVMHPTQDDIPAAMTVLRARRRRKGTRRTTVEETPEGAGDPGDPQGSRSGWKWWEWVGN